MLEPIDKVCLNTIICAMILALKQCCSSFPKPGWCRHVENGKTAVGYLKMYIITMKVLAPLCRAAAVSASLQFRLVFSTSA